MSKVFLIVMIAGLMASSSALAEPCASAANTGTVVTNAKDSTAAPTVTLDANGKPVAPSANQK